MRARSRASAGPRIRPGWAGPSRSRPSAPAAGCGSPRSTARKGRRGKKRTIIDVTDGRFRDESPSFTPDGKYLAFLSNRSFDPVYDGHSFDLSFPSPIKPYLVALAADTPSPFGPTVDLPEGADDAEEGADAAEGSAKGHVPAVRVDAEGLAHRVISVPVRQGNYSDLSAAHGALLWLDSELAGVTGEGRASQDDKNAAPSLVRFDLAKRRTSTVVEALERYRLSGDGEKVVFVQDKQIRVSPAAAKADEESGPVGHRGPEPDPGPAGSPQRVGPGIRRGLAVAARLLLD